ncbi:MAG: hypothetical protein IJ617_00310 [Oscillospiraceae bacterium]|nr:hypothetical protein [Oscillospiraceae bacterium]
MRLFLPPSAEEPPPYRELDYDSIRENIENMASPEPPRALGMFRYPDQLEYQIDDVSRFSPVSPIWKTMINAGSINGLLNVNVCEQLTLLQEELGFRYARMESVLTDESIPALPGGQYNFSHFDRAIEQLLSLKLTPFLDLSFKGDPTLLSRSGGLYRGDRPRARSTEREFLEKTAALLRHCINTFGAGEVETWGVELCALHDERLFPLEKPAEYGRRFVAAFRMIKQWLPHMLVGGPEHHVAMDNAFLKEVAEHIRAEGIEPDFFSLCAIPYVQTQPGSNDVPLVISPDPDFIPNTVRELREIIRHVMGKPVPLWITVFGPDIRTRNHLNDSLYQATFLVKNTIDLIGLADVLGYWQLSDIENEYTDTTRALFGGTGILSKDGLKKPGFTALKRMARLCTQMVERSAGLLVTTNGINTYNVVLYNYSHFNDTYCLSTGEGINPDMVYTVFRDSAARDITLRLGGLPRGRYRVITVTLNREYGCLFDDWMAYGILDNMQPYDLHYLRDIVHPHRAVQYYECTDGTIELAMQMLPHEVKFLTILLEL